MVIQIVGDSGSGKTLVIERSVRALAKRRLRVAVVKHSHHFPDLAGKDTARFRAAGASIVLFASRPSFVVFPSSPAALVPILPADVVLIEGFSRRRFGPLRFRIRHPGEAAGVVRRVLAAAPTRRIRRSVVVDGKVRNSDPLWEVVLGVMAARGVEVVRRPA